MFQIDSDSILLNTGDDYTINRPNCTFAFGIISSASSNGSAVGIYSTSNGNGGWNVRIKNFGSNQTIGYTIVKIK